MALKIPNILKLLFANNDCILKKAIGTLHLLQHTQFITRERRASVRYVNERAASTSNVFPPLPPARSFNKMHTLTVASTKLFNPLHSTSL